MSDQSFGEDTLTEAEVEASVTDMERSRSVDPRPRPCGCERPAPYRDEFGDVRCWQCGRAPR
jgi:hypothetical protein